MTGMEYVLSEVMEPHLFVMRKQKRDSPEKVTLMLTYYVMDGSIYQAPQLSNVFAARIGRALYHISKAFTTAASKLEKIGHVDAENESAASEPKAAKEAIITFLHHFNGRLAFGTIPPAPPPPPFPEGYAPPSDADREKGTESQETDPQPSVDPIIDHGPSKRLKS